jgi:hypothetical protein
MVVVAFRLLSLLLMNSATLMISLINCEDHCKNICEGLMSRNDE